MKVIFTSEVNNFADTMSFMVFTKILLILSSRANVEWWEGESEISFNEIRVCLACSKTNRTAGHGMPEHQIRNRKTLNTKSGTKSATVKHGTLYPKYWFTEP